MSNILKTIVLILDIIFLHIFQSSNGPVLRSMHEKAVDRRNINKEHNSNFKAGYVPIEEERLHRTGLRGRKGNLAICVIALMFILAVINLIVSILLWQYVDNNNSNNKSVNTKLKVF